MHWVGDRFHSLSLGKILKTKQNKEKNRTEPRMLLYYVKCPIFIKKNYEPCQEKQESLTCTQGKRQSMETDWVGQEVGFSRKSF